jgi:hypothetical protein
VFSCSLILSYDFTEIFYICKKCATYCVSHCWQNVHLKRCTCIYVVCDIFASRNENHFPMTALSCEEYAYESLYILYICFNDWEFLTEMGVEIKTFLKIREETDSNTSPCQMFKAHYNSSNSYSSHSNVHVFSKISFISFVICYA